MALFGVTAHSTSLAEASKVESIPRRTRQEKFSIVLAFSVVGIFIGTFVVQPFEIPSFSMEKTLLHGDFVLVNKVSCRAEGRWPHFLPYEQIQRGDIVVFRFPRDPSQYMAKRIIGLPGERLRLSSGEVFIGGKPLAESYTIRKATPADRFRDDFPAAAPNSAAVDPGWRANLARYVHDGEIDIPEGQYFVLGDNRDASLDSRYWGFVPAEDIVGLPFLIYWSMDLPDRPPFAASLRREVADLTYATTHFVSLTRWRRILRTVR